MEPISGSRSRRYSTRMVANSAEVDKLARKELATIWEEDGIYEMEFYLVMG